MRRLSAIALLTLAALSRPAAAIDAAVVEKLAFGESDEKVAAIGALVASGDEQALSLLQALADGSVQAAGKRVLIVAGDEGRDVVSGERVRPLPEDREDIVLNNRLRREIDSALGALKLVSPDRATRLKAAGALEDGADAAVLPLVKKALGRETDPKVKRLLEQIAASIEVKSDDAAVRLAAVRTLGQSGNPNNKTLLLSLLAKKDGGVDDETRVTAEQSLRAVEGRLAWGERLGLAFAGVSLGSILLLAALGLAITYGLMGVINMAHGELIMIGAYATYVVQSLFRSSGFFDWYLLAAVPSAFMVCGLLGMALERSVIRWLYGRSLETLLATWGISLILMQAVRTLFGAQNVQVENPSFMSGGIQVLSNVVLPWNRIVIIVFAVTILLGMWILLSRTRLGLYIRGVTQNRAMASCVGVPTARVDTWAFGLGSGIAGLAGCALSQIGNVGPDLG